MHNQKRLRFQASFARRQCPNVVCVPPNARAEKEASIAAPARYVVRIGAVGELLLFPPAGWLFSEYLHDALTFRGIRDRSPIRRPDGKTGLPPIGRKPGHHAAQEIEQPQVIFSVGSVDSPDE